MLPSELAPVAAVVALAVPPAPSSTIARWKLGVEGGKWLTQVSGHASEAALHAHLKRDMPSGLLGCCAIEVRCGG